MAELATIQKQLKIKAGVVQRYNKEMTLYRKEVVDLGGKLTRLVADGTEEWDVKNMKRMIEESEKMILDTETKLDKAKGELKDLVKRVEGTPGVAASDEFVKAQGIVTEDTA
ncbi:hypothetical protein AGABI1DRAFT_88809 [Agaricus bisporus var. burnettii JB137-S8]|uniref:Tubulin-specific chaperone A n=1 Tax=Agaricus bisporus var. burnettii (strain JB137-S8 / ATCC MYA-4627 / FGSC 10392) TaxID=597362 RepID=K5X7W2_AGABU|nr:uncharacterized protein AGABI1DRAFT_88809 [Agaricus bisporus var. burnettii JB137-S8]EKM84006.1 hypothetical protein AGABI1DRAFT_88809 [Agaricus bisporus var. burnettii JB137-S8]